ALGVEHLAAQRKDRLPRPIPSLLRRSAGRIALDDEDLAVLARRVRAVAEFAGKVEAARCGALARDLGLGRAARLARPRGQDDAGDDRLGDADVVIKPVLERGTDDAIDL